MPPLDPHVPSQSEKRRHDSDESSDEDGYGPTLPTVHKKRKSPSPEPAPKRSRIIGPSLPPANLDERPMKPPEAKDESSDDDDFGPTLPSTQYSSMLQPGNVRESQTAAEPSQWAPKSTRDEWMLVPPSSGDWTSRVDPTKLKNRTFNTGKSAKGAPPAAGGDSAKWTETPAEKKARLEREMMGITDAPKPKGGTQQPVRSEESAKKLREYAVCFKLLSYLLVY